MWKVAQELLEILVFAFIITQVIVPLVLDKPLFWIFRKSKKVEQSNDGPYDFDSEVSSLEKEHEEKSQSLNDTVDEIHDKAEKLNRLKNKTKKP